jgi:hypothetical protein
MFKKLFLLALLACSSLTIGMEKPYQSWFSAKYPVIKSLTAGATAAVLTYAASNFFQSKHATAYSLMAGAAAVAGVWAYDAFKKSQSPKNQKDKPNLVTPVATEQVTTPIVAKEVPLLAVTVDATQADKDLKLLDTQKNETPKSFDTAIVNKDDKVDKKNSTIEEKETKDERKQILDKDITDNAIKSDEKPHFLDRILANPQEALRSLNNIASEALKEIEENKKLNQIKACTEVLPKAKERTGIIKKYELQSPLFLLNERKWHGSKPCTLNRFQNPKIREAYEAHIVETLLQKSKESENITYASFECDQKFQDLIIIGKFLAKNPTAKLAIHLIDSQHTPSITYLALSGKSRQITIEELKYQDAVMPQLIKIAKTQWGTTGKDARISLDLFNLITQVDLECKEFLNCLQSKFPKADIKLFIHDSAENYYNAIEKEKYQYPDIVTAADISHDNDNANDKSKTKKTDMYIELCRRMLTKKPDTFNLLLTTNDKNKPCINTYYLQPIEESTEPLTITYSDGKTEKIYLKTTEI